MRRLVLVCCLLLAGCATAHPSASSAPSASRPRSPTMFGLSGPPSVGQVLTSSPGTWTGNPTSFAYQWKDCDASGANCTAISGATASTYTVASADVGQTLAVTVTASSATGSASATSDPTALVTSGATTTSTTSTTSTTTSTTPTASCDLYASPTGTGGAAGTTLDPLDLATMVNSRLAAGQTGCLLAGTYGAAPDATGATPDTGTYWHFTGAGTSTSQITVTAAPGDASTPTVRGWFRQDGAYVTWSHLNIDGSNTYDDSCAQQTPNALSSQSASTPSDCDQAGGGYACPAATATVGRYRDQDVDLNGTGDVLDHDSVYESAAGIRRNLVGIGFQASTSGVVIRYSLLHDAGGCGTQHDHLLYVHTSTGGAHVYDDWLYNGSSGQAAILYPDSNGTHVDHNVVDSSSSGWNIGGGGSASNTLDHNFTTNLSTFEYDEGTTAQGAAIGCYQAGTGNTLDATDWFSAPGGAGSCSAAAITNTTNVDPQYVNASAHDYTVQDAAFASWGMPTLSQMGPAGS